MKTNKIFMILSALGIVFVVDAHSRTALQPMTYYFDYNTFFMPMFVFISGYFFQQKYITNIGKTMKKKAMRLLVPYFIWGYLYCAIEAILLYFGVIKYDLDLTWQEALIRPWTKGYICDLVAPTWFVMAIIMTQIAYFLIRKMMNRYWNEIVAMVLFIITGMVSIYCCRQGVNHGLILPILKVGFFLQFYQLGIIYKIYIEKYFIRCPKMYIMLAAVIINTLLWMRYKDNILFLDLTLMDSFKTNNLLLPLITSITGISFWLCIAIKLAPVLGHNRLVNFISDHTYEIMTHHYLFFNLFNAVLYLISRFLIDIQFNIDEFRTSAWYHLEPVIQFRIFYLLVGLGGPLLIIYFIEKLRNNNSINLRGEKIGGVNKVGKES